MGILFGPVCSRRFIFEEFPNAKKKEYSGNLQFSPVDVEGEVVEITKNIQKQFLVYWENVLEGIKRIFSLLAIVVNCISATSVVVYAGLFFYRCDYVE